MGVILVIIAVCMLLLSMQHDDSFILCLNLDLMSMDFGCF